MKKCPNCNQVFPDDNFFCLEDGTTLLPVLSTTENLPVFPTPDSAPTQVVTRPHSQRIPDSSKWLYLIIGVMATTIIALGIAFYFPRSTSEREANSKSTEEATKITEEKSSEVVEEKPVAAKANSAAENARRQSPAENTNITVSPPRPLPLIDPNLNPVSRWSGDWTSKKAHYPAVLVLNDNGGGKFTGEIFWTLQRHTNPKKIFKAGSTATEYVRGTFNPASRMLILSGYRKDDPNDIVILDKYSLTLAENNQSLSGGSKSNGRFVLSR